RHEARIFFYYTQPGQNSLMHARTVRSAYTCPRFAGNPLLCMKIAFVGDLLRLEPLIAHLYSFKHELLEIRKKLRLPSVSRHPISADLVSVGEDVHCEFVKKEVHSGFSARSRSAGARVGAADCSCS